MDMIFASELKRKDKPGNHQLSNKLRFNFKQWNLKQDLQRGKTAEILSRCREQVFLHPVICLNFYRIERSQRATAKLFENIWTKVWLKTLRAASQKMRGKTCPKVATRRIVIWKVLKEKKVAGFWQDQSSTGGRQRVALCSALIWSLLDPSLASAARLERKGRAWLLHHQLLGSSTFALIDRDSYKFFFSTSWYDWTFWRDQERPVLLSSPK